MGDRAESLQARYYLLVYANGGGLCARALVGLYARLFLFYS